MESIIRESARLTLTRRNEELERRGRPTLFLFSAIARAVARQDRDAALSILAHSKLASSFLTIHDFAPALVDNISFVEAYRAAKEQDIAERSSVTLSLPAASYGGERTL